MACTRNDYRAQAYVERRRARHGARTRKLVRRSCSNVTRVTCSTPSTIHLRILPGTSILCKSCASLILCRILCKSDLIWSHLVQVWPRPILIDLICRGLIWSDRVQVWVVLGIWQSTIQYNMYCRPCSILFTQWASKPTLTLHKYCLSQKIKKVVMKLQGSWQLLRRVIFQPRLEQPENF